MTKTFEKHGDKIIYIDSLGIRKPKASKGDILRILKRFKALFKPYKKVSDNIWIVSPFVIPLHRFKIVKIFNDLFLSFIIKILMFFLNFKEYMIWTYSPVTNTIVDKFSPCTIVYHCVDNLSALPNVDKDILKQKEIELINKSNFIFTTSKNLYNYIKPLNNNTFYQNNVCDYKHFTKAKNEKFDLPKDLRNIKGPKIVFVGAISSYKINFDLISTIANNNKNWNFIMIGQIGEGQPETNISIIENCQNIHLLGPKDYIQIPRYLHFADVAIIPSNLNGYTKSMFPMKFFEYLSAGLQVVTTNLTSLYEYRELCFISNDEEEFENNLKTILEEKQHKSQKKIDNECLKHTWDNRYLTMMKLIGEY